MDQPGATWHADAVLRCVANAKPTLHHTLNCKLRSSGQAEDCVDCAIVDILAECSSRPCESIMNLDTNRLFKLVRAVLCSVGNLFAEA